MVNENYEANDDDDAVMAVLEAEGRANPYLLREETGLDKGAINNALSRLTAAGWVSKRTRGLYDYVDDPRSDQHDLVDDALASWRPGQGGDDTRRRREIGTAVLRWLRDHGDEAGKAEFVDALYDETHLDGQNADSWWETTARSALQHAEEQGVVGYGSRKYWWEG